MNAKEAEAPAVFEVTRTGRVLVFSFGSVTSGIPLRWAAAQDRPGVNLLGDLSHETSHRIAAQMQDARSPGDTAIASIHWGGNWGYDIPEAQIRFAHSLIDEGVDLVYGHSSHHAKAMEVYQGCPIFYGCGDFLTDYEGIRGHEAYRGDLAVMYLITLDPPQSGLSHSPCNDISGRCTPWRGAQRRSNLDPQDGKLLRCARNGMLIEVRLIPLQVRHFRLNRASATDARWLHRMLNRESTPFGTMISLSADNSLTVQLP
ncbi:MAG: hypothetical protein A2Y76_07240 [Planctomycetes bacterium RBG_13_60_9]|nr:MAG: hypothetical protein A2Y76_07240 [Planctomycetes bacterium RBG_13_60_9]